MNLFLLVKGRMIKTWHQIKLVQNLPAIVKYPWLTKNFVYDLERFYRASSVGKGGDKRTHLSARITMEYHAIEKGLALKHPKPLFGRERVERLINFLSDYRDLYGDDDLTLITVNTLAAYREFNLDTGLKDENLFNKIEKIQFHCHDSLNKKGGYLDVRKQEIHEKAKLNLLDFFNSRYSIRNFSAENVENRLIEKAALMARKTPSVCNRQSSKVYVFSEKRIKEKILYHQNGNRGFGELASKILIVTSDMGNFVSVGERNQCWIDGGLFSMSLIYAFHSLGVGTCCLNWSVESKTDQNMRQIAGIPDTEAVIMMIAVGHLPDVLRVAQSPRKDIEEVLIFKQ